MSMSEKLRKKTCCCANRRLQACQADIKSSSVGAERVWEILQTTRNWKKVNVSIIIWHFFVSREKVSVGCTECGSVPDEQTGLPPRSKQVFQSFVVPSRDYINFNETSGENNIHPNAHLLERWKLTFQHAAISPYLSKTKKKVLFILKYFKFCGLDWICKEEGMLCLSNLSQLFSWFHFFGGFSNIAPAFAFSQALPPVSSQVTLNALLGIAESVLRCNYLSWQRSCASCLWSNIPTENSCTLQSPAAFISDCLNSLIPRDVKAKRRLSHVHAIKTKWSCADLFNGRSAGKFWANLSVELGQR